MPEGDPAGYLPRSQRKKARARKGMLRRGLAPSTSTPKPRSFQPVTGKPGPKNYPSGTRKYRPRRSA